MEIYRILADLVYWFHWFWIFLMIGGAFLSIKYKWYRPYHAVIMVGTIASQLIFLGCPLTTLENALRAHYDPNATYMGSFICYCLQKYLGIQLAPQYIILAMVLIILVSAFILLRRPK